MTLEYKTKTASKEQIYLHLKECDDNFRPPLSSRVDLLDYSDKIYMLAVSFEAWDENVLVGMVNTYLNDESDLSGFITNTSVLKGYMRKGVASTLLQMCLEYARNHSFSRISLEVSCANGTAIELYSHAGFKASRILAENLLMNYEIAGKPVRSCSEAITSGRNFSD